MQPDPARIDETHAWFLKARSDLRASAVAREVVEELFGALPIS